MTHEGGMEGVSTSLKLIFSENLAVVGLANGHNRKIYGLQHEILSALHPKFAHNHQAQEKKAGEKRAEKFLVPASLKGEIKTYSGVMPLEFIFQNDGDDQVKVKDHLETLINDVEFKDLILTDNSYWKIQTEDARRTPHILFFNLKLRNENSPGLTAGVSCR